MPLAVVPQALVDEFTAVVNVQLQQFEGRLAADSVNGSAHPALALAAYGYGFDPTADQVHGQQGVQVESFGARSAMGNQVHFHVPYRQSLLVREGANRDHRAQAWYRVRGTQPMPGPEAIRPQEPIDGRGTHPHQLTAHGWRYLQLAVMLQQRKQLLQERRQTLGTQTEGCFPGHLQRQDKVPTILLGSSAALTASRSLTMQQPDGRLAMVASDLAEFIQDDLLLRTTGSQIPVPQCRRILPDAPSGQVALLR